MVPFLHCLAMQKVVDSPSKGAGVGIRVRECFSAISPGAHWGHFLGPTLVARS